MKYIIAYATEPDDLQSQVNAMISVGYMPHGSPFVQGSRCCQALLLQSEPVTVCKCVKPNAAASPR